MSFKASAVATKLDRDSKAFLEQANSAEGPPLEQMPLDDARHNLKELYLSAGEPFRRLFNVKDIEIDGAGGSIALRIYSSKRHFLGAAPAILFFHGGGWALGDVRSYDNFCRFLAWKTSAKVISVEYRLAPKHKFPAGLSDCFAAVDWLAANARKQGVNTERVAVMGDSAGGNFAALAAIRARDEGMALAAQVLLYPVLALDGGRSFPSRMQFGGGDYFISQASIAWTVDLYLESMEDAASPLATPLNIENLDGLAPALLVVGGFDPLRDECKAYADRLSAVGVTTDFRCYHTTIHGFMSYSGALRVGRKGLADTAAWIKRRL